MNEISNKEKNKDNKHEIIGKNIRQDDAINLWNQYQKQLNKKKMGSAIFISIVLFIVILLVFIGLYIVMSTHAPLSGS
ncbi:hypothetical protein [Fluviispira sanaruensis]|uniref:Uncharacterized protein n=1 Tax=Fluviispira sanaruensis TaxID=2493639 RepID=A0A4P2VNE5_FLUSA|nr:hypothetical protein [Fluviispira sanaruensis]BBH53654.1 hypothetical protein JCM31447_21010 [Fluviispira sanaruensis]